MPMLESTSQASVPRDAFPPTPPGPEGSNGNGLLRVQWVSGAWLKSSSQLLAFSSYVRASIGIDFSRASAAHSARTLLKLAASGAEVLCIMPSLTFPPLQQKQPSDFGTLLSPIVPMWIFDRRTLEVLEVNEA